jgi:hypothetical protein
MGCACLKQLAPISSTWGGLLLPLRVLVPAVGGDQHQRRGQVSHDLARVMHCPRRPPRLQSLRQAPAQPGDPHRLTQQDRPGLGHQAPAIRRHRHPPTACAIVHLESAFSS